MYTIVFEDNIHIALYHQSDIHDCVGYKDPCLFYMALFESSKLRLVRLRSEKRTWINSSIPTVQQKLNKITVCTYFTYSTYYSLYYVKTIFYYNTMNDILQVQSSLNTPNTSTRKSSYCHTTIIIIVRIMTGYGRKIGQIALNSISNIFHSDAF